MKAGKGHDNHKIRTTTISFRVTDEEKATLGARIKVCGLPKGGTEVEQGGTLSKQGGFMTFKERNLLIKELINDYQDIHSKYTTGTQVLSDPEWEQYIDEIRKRGDKLKGTGLYNFAIYSGQAFLDDTEYVQKELKKIHD